MTTSPSTSKTKSSPSSSISIIHGVFSSSKYILYNFSMGSSWFMTSTLRGILIQLFKTQSKNKNRNTTLPPLASCMFPCLGPNQPISALSSDSSANADHDHVLPSCFIVSPVHRLYFSEPMCSFPDPILDAGLAGCKPVPCHGCRRLHLHSR